MHKSDRSLLDSIRNAFSSPILSIFLILGIVVLLFIDIAGLRLFGSRYDPARFGSVGEWFSGTAASLAILFYWLSFAHARDLAAEARALADPQLLLRQKSSTVYLWIEISHDASGFARETEIIVHNATPIPIYDWSIKTPDSNEIVSSAVAFPLLPGQNRVSLRAVSPNLIPDSVAAVIALRYVGLSGDTFERSSKGDLQIILADGTFLEGG